MNTRISLTQVLKIAVDIGVIPATATMDRKGRSTWSTDQFTLVAIVERRRDGRLGWHAFIGDLELGPAMSEFGGLSVGIDPAIDDAVDWPTTGASREPVERFLRHGVGIATEFVIDRLDLARLLASEVNVQRRSLTTWLLPANYPARLVQALIIAQDLGSTELEAEIQQRLTCEKITLPSGQQIDVKSTAKHWAKEYARVLGREISVP